MAITEITVSKIYVLATEPTNKVKDRFWFDTTNNLLKRYTGSSWKPISVSSDDVAVLSDGSKISLTNYLNTQIAALVEGIDSKQDKLNYYTENISSKSANISINKSTIGLSETKGITLTAGNSGDPENIGLKLNSSSIILDSTDPLIGGTTNLLTIETSSKGSISSLSGDLISKSITSLSTDTQLPTSKAVKTELDKKQNSTDNTLTTTAKTITGAINELSADKQATLETYKEKQGPNNNDIIITSTNTDGITGDITLTTDGGSISSPGNIKLECGSGSTGGSIDIIGGVGGHPGNINLEISGESGSGNGNGHINLKAANVSSGTGGDINLSAGHSSNNTGGDINITSGQGPITSGDINLIAESSSTSSGGNINLKINDSGNGTAGNITLTSGDSSSEDGGKITLTAGETTGNYQAFGSNITLNGGNSTTGAGGAVEIEGGTGNSTSGNGGNVKIKGGTGDQSDGSYITIEGGIGTSRSGGNIDIKGGGAWIDGGSIGISGGTGGTGNGGSINISGGSGTVQGGNIDITAGSAIGENSESGKIKLNVPDNSGIVVDKDFIELNYKGDNSVPPELRNWRFYIGGSGSGNTTDFSNSKTSSLYLGYGDYSTNINLGGSNSNATINICSAGSSNNNVINIGTAKTTNYINIGPSDGHSEYSTLTLNCERLSGKTFNTELTSTADNNHIPTSKAVYDALSNKQDKLSTYSETIPTDTSYPEEVVITAKGQQFVASNGAGKITLSATDSTDSGDGFSAGTINLNASKVQQNGVDIATATDLANKQNKLLYYSETSGDTPSATISVDNIKLNGKVAEGNNTKALGNYSHAEGNNTKALGNYSHAEGNNTTASGYCSHAEGNNTTASGANSHAEGFATEASGNYSHAEGVGTTASGEYSHAEGNDTIASSKYQHAQGKFNIEDANNNYADIIGNGSSASARSNAATVSWDGISWSQTDVRAGGTDQDSATYSLAALSEGKQDKLVFYREEDTSTRQEALIRGADSFSILSTNKGLILDGNNGGITIRNSTIKDQDLIYIESNTFGAGRSIISIANSTWNDDAILFNIEGEVIKISDALLIPQIKNKQNSTDTALNTTDKTIVGAINELRKSIIGAFDPITDVWTATTASTLTSIISDATYANTPGRILISPKITNTGAIKVGDNITDISKAFPLYPDQIVSFTFSDINNFKVAADSVNDGFNYIIEFSVISPYTSQSIQTTE